MKNTAKMIMFLFVITITTILLPLNSAYAQGTFVIQPKILDYNATSNGGELTFEFQVSPTYYDNVVYWVITPESVTLNAVEIQTESQGSTYPGGSLGYTTSLQTVTTDNISYGPNYKLNYVVSNYGSLLPASQGEVVFKGMSFIDTPVAKTGETSDFSVDIVTDETGTIYGALYLVGHPHSKEDILDSQGTALAYDKIEISNIGETATLNFTYDDIKSTIEYVIYLVKEDAYGNYFYSDTPIQVTVGESKLSQILIGDLPLKEFNSSTYEYKDVEIPYGYAGSLNGDYSSLVKGISDSGQTINAVHDDTLGIEKIIIKENGMERKAYEINTVINNMSLSNISLDDKSLDGFNRFSNSFSSTLLNGTTAIPKLTAISENPAATVNIVGSGSLPGTYTYNITVSYGGSEKVYTVVLNSLPDNKPLNILAKAGAGGSISPSGNIEVAKGNSKSFTITPNSKYSISDVKIDGESKGKLASYTFNNVMENHTIEAIFSYNGSSSGGGNGGSPLEPEKPEEQKTTDKKPIAPENKPETNLQNKVVKTTELSAETIKTLNSFTVPKNLVKGLTIPDDIHIIDVEGKNIVFKDIKAHWAKDSILEATKRGLLNGVSENEFGPTSLLTREQTLVGLNNVFMNNNIIEMKLKRDVVERQLSEIIKDPTWSTFASAQALGNTNDEMLSNIAKNPKLLKAEVTRQDMADLIYALGKDIFQTQAKNSVEFCKEMGFMVGDKNGDFEEQRVLNRAELASILLRLDDKFSKI